MMLRALVSLVTPEIRRATARMWRREPADRLYRSWLAISFDLVRATAPLLTEAVGEAMRRHDRSLADYFVRQLDAEYGHDAWLLEDFMATGGDPRQLRSRIPCPAAARLVGAQYYYLRHVHPIALLGHIAVLEWHAPEPGLVPELVRRTGFPREAFRTLYRHCELDGGHGALLDRALTDLGLAGELPSIVRTSALATADGLIDLLDGMGEQR